MEALAPIRIRRPAQDAGSLQQDDIAAVTTETMLVPQASYTAPAIVVGVLWRAKRTMLDAHEGDLCTSLG